jgi:hypothetical protein
MDRGCGKPLSIYDPDTDVRIRFSTNAWKWAFDDGTDRFRQEFADAVALAVKMVAAP